MKKPTRVQRKRTKGWKMPANTVYVGRPTKWGNPYDTADRYRSWFLSNGATPMELLYTVDELRGKNLACWCPLDKPCHADVLLQFANPPEWLTPKMYQKQKKEEGI